MTQSFLLSLERNTNGYILFINKFLKECDSGRNCANKSVKYIVKSNQELGKNDNNITNTIFIVQMKIELNYG